MTDDLNARLTSFSKATGIRLSSAGDGCAKATLDVADGLTNRRGVVHGGALATLLDTVMGAAVISAMKPEEWCATISLNIQFIAGAYGGQVKGAGHVQKRGKSTAFAAGEVHDDKGRLLASAQGVWHIWPTKPSRPSASQP